MLMKTNSKKVMWIGIIAVAVIFATISGVLLGGVIRDRIEWVRDMNHWVEVTGKEMDDEMMKVYDEWGIEWCLVLHEVQEEAEANRARYKYEITQNDIGNIKLTAWIEGQREPWEYVQLAVNIVD